jgi:hypothetical protein
MNFEKMISNYRAVREQIQKLDEEHEAFMADRRKLLAWLGDALLNMLNATNQDSAKTPAGTAYITTKVSATLNDPEKFRTFVIDGQRWEMIDWRANKTAVKDYVSEHEKEPPGVNYVPIRTVGVRAPTKKQSED